MKSKFTIVLIVIFGVLVVIAFFAYKSKKEMNVINHINENEVFYSAQKNDVSLDVIDGVYIVDLGKSDVEWIGRANGKKHFGSVSLKEGNFIFADGIFENGSVTADMTSITNSDLVNPMRDKLVAHLRSNDFFAVSDHPTSQLTIKSIEKKDEGKTYSVVADLNIKNISNEIIFDARVEEYGGSISFEAVFDVDRTAWGINYGIDSGAVDKIKDLLIDEKITLDIMIIGLKR